MIIDNLRGFPNQAIPAVYGESLSYTQQVAYLMQKIQECIDYINGQNNVQIPQPTNEDVGNIAEVYIDQTTGKLAVKWSDTYRNDITDIEETITDVETELGTKQRKVTSASGSLEAGSWVNNYQTVTVQGIGANDILVVSAPANDDVANAQFAENQIRAYSQDTNSITFKCGSVPSEAVNFIVMIVKPN